MGPSEAHTEFDNAIAHVLSGGKVIIAARSANGSVANLADRIPPDLTVHSRLACAQACFTSVGQVADDLEVDGFEGGVIVLEDAQWADPTSLGHLQRLVSATGAPLLLVLAYRPSAGVDTWWLDRFREAAGKHADVVDIEVDDPPTDPGIELEGDAADLAIAASLVTGAIPVATCSRLLAMDEHEVLEVGSRLVDQGVLTESRGGYASAPGFNIGGMGEARIGFVAGRLADAIAAEDRQPAVVAGLRLAAGQSAEAVPLLVAAAREAGERNAAGEAFRLAESALSAAEDANIDEPAVGELHLICGRFLRTAGRTEWAARHLDQATAHLRGRDRVEALRLAAAVADDSQHPQQAERIVAMAEWEAFTSGAIDQLGQLLTLRARALNRIGFASESDATLEKALGLLDQNTSPLQFFHARRNRAWIHFDRGEVRRAELEFSQLREEAESLEGSTSLADIEAWRARALFAAGQPGEAMSAVAFAQDLSTATDLEGPVFLTQLALAEGGLAFGQYDDALAATERALDLVERQLPAWENMVRCLRAQALMRLGRHDDASREIQIALDATPSGADGWRWRIRCRAIQMEISGQAGATWPAAEADDLADLMLQSRLYGWAAELLCVIAEQGRGGDAAANALALASVIGNPMLAARAAQAGDLWNDEAAIPAIVGVRSISRHLPPGWEEAWNALEPVRVALEMPDPADDPDFTAAAAAMDDALEAAGLANVDVVLSPAQRRGQGLVRQGRRIRPLLAIAAGLGVIVVAGATALGVAQLTRTEPTPTPTSAPTAAAPVTTDAEPLTLEETQISVDTERGFLFGTAELRGDPGRGGFVDVSGPRSVSGYYWKVRTAGAIDATPVAFGQQLFIGTTEGTFYALDQTTGEEVWTLPPEGRISTAAALGLADVGEGRTPSMVVVADDAGVVRAHQAGISGAAPWSTQLDGRIRSSPIITNEQVVVATSEGRVHGLDLIEGTILWTYPGEGEGIGAVSADLAFSDGLVYVATQEGLLHVLDVSNGPAEAVCTFDARDPIVVNPIVVGDVVYVGTTAQNIWVLPAGECEGRVPGRLPLYATETPVDVAMAIVGDIMYIPDGPYLYAKNLADNTDVWTPGDVDANSAISAPPVVTRDAVYFASEDGVVHAVDAFTGEALWTWQTGLHVRGSPAVVDDVVYVVSGDGFVYALGD